MRILSPTPAACANFCHLGVPGRLLSGRSVPWLTRRDVLGKIRGVFAHNPKHCRLYFVQTRQTEEVEAGHSSNPT